MSNPSVNVELDGKRYCVKRTRDGRTLVYKEYPGQVYKGMIFTKLCLIWGDKRRNHTPKIGSTVARVMAAADDKK